MLEAHPADVVSARSGPGLSSPSSRRRLREYLGERTIVTVGLWLLTALVMLPLLLVLLTAISPSSSVTGGFALPSRLTTANLTSAWQIGRFGASLRASVIVTSTVVIVVTVMSVLAGYSLAVLRPVGSRVFIALFLLGLIVPFEAMVVPLYYHLRTVDLTDTFWSLILPQSALSLSFGVYWMRSFFRNVPPSVLDACRIDGASDMRTLWNVLIPMARPAIVTLVILTFMWNWNEFLLPLIMILNPQLQTAPLSLAMFQGQHTVDVAGQAAGAVIIAAPVVLLYLLLQRRVLSGLTESAFRR
jgi:raffinose/stachyose/melibiose transport system permease protein